MQDQKERPMLKDAGKYVDYIDDATWQRLVGALLDSDGVEILSRHSREIFVGIGAGTRLYRVAGTAVNGGRRPADWSMVVKVLTLDQLNFQSISPDQTAWDYWKREWHVYRSPWQQQLPGPLVAPRCLATGEILAETDSELAWIAMEDLQALDHRPWPAGNFREVARHLGTFNGDYLTGRPLPTDPWLSRDWLRGWTELAEPQMGYFPRFPATRSPAESSLLIWSTTSSRYGTCGRSSMRRSINCHRPCVTTTSSPATCLFAARSPSAECGHRLGLLRRGTGRARASLLGRRDPGLLREPAGTLGRS